MSTLPATSSSMAFVRATIWPLSYRTTATSRSQSDSCERISKPRLAYSIHTATAATDSRQGYCRAARSISQSEGRLCVRANSHRKYLTARASSTSRPSGRYALKIAKAARRRPRISAAEANGGGIPIVAGSSGLVKQTPATRWSFVAGHGGPAPLGIRPREHLRGCDPKNPNMPPELAVRDQPPAAPDDPRKSQQGLLYTSSTHPAPGCASRSGRPLFRCSRQPGCPPR